MNQIIVKINDPNMQLFNQIMDQTMDQIMDHVIINKNNSNNSIKMSFFDQLFESNYGSNDDQIVIKPWSFKGSNNGLNQLANHHD